MGTDFTAAEAFDLASKIEGKAAKFYAGISDWCRDDTSAQIFATLAVVENQHEQVFAAIGEGLGKQKDLDTDSQQHWPEVAKSLLNNIDRELPISFQNCKTVQDILRGAMSVEKDALDFFQWIKRMVPDGPERKKVDQIIQEDMGHLISLGSQLASL